MKKDQNLPNKNVHSNNSSGKPFPNNTNYIRTQSPHNSSYRGRSPERRHTQNSSQNHYNRPNSRNNYSRSNSNTTQFVSRSNSQSRNKYYPNNQSRNSSYNRSRNYSNNRNRSYSNNRNQYYPNNRSRNNSYNRSNGNYQNRSRNNSQNRHSSYNNRYRSYSQSPHRNNNHYNNSNNRHRSSTPKHQRHINQVQSNPETTSDPPGIDDTVNDTLQLNQINCGSSDSESDTENTLSINMIAVENDYEPIIYEQPFSSHLYENQSELLRNYYIEPIHSTQTRQETNEINITNQSIENDKTKCLNTNHIYQNIQKEQPKEKIRTIPFLLESPRNKEFQPPDLEIDFLIDSGAESNIINIPTWNEIKTLHPKLTPLKTSSKLATAQGSTLVNYGKIQLFLLPTRTLEQNKILNKPFKQIFHITDTKHNIIGIPFISKYIPKINILNSKILIKDKYTKTKDTSITFFQRLNKEEQPKGNTFINPVIILAKGESLKIVLDARYLNSLIDESKCNWPIEPIQVILTKINGKYFTTADMNSAYNQMPLDEQSRRLTQFVIGNQQYEFNRLFYGISIGPAAFSAFMSKIFRPLILKKNAITYLDDVFMQSQTKEETFNVLEHYHKILQNENLKAASDKSHFFLTRVKLLGHNIERKTITPLKSRIDAIQKLEPPQIKRKSKNSLEC